MHNLVPTRTKETRDYSSQVFGQSSKLRFGETRVFRSNDSPEI